MDAISAALIRDTRMSRTARILGLNILHMAQEPTEIEKDSLAHLMGPITDTELSSAFAELEQWRWVESLRTGKDRYLCLWAHGSTERTIPSQPDRHIPDDIRELVYERDGRACSECGSVQDTTLDHIVPFSHGGTHTPENLRVLCRPCNARRGNRV